MNYFTIEFCLYYICLLVFLILFIREIYTEIRRKGLIKRVFLRHMHEGFLYYRSSDDPNCPYLMSVFFGMYLYGSSYKEFFKYACTYIRKTPVRLVDVGENKISNTILKFENPKKGELTFEILDSETHEYISKYTVHINDNCDKRFLRWIDHFTTDYNINRDKTEYSSDKR